MAFQRCPLLVTLVFFAVLSLALAGRAGQGIGTTRRTKPRNTKTERRGTTPLHTALLQGHSVEEVRVLLRAGEANVNQAMETGDTPLYIAAHEGHLDAVVVLVDAGASVDQAADSGATPLIMAAYNGHLEVVRALVEAGADKSVRTLRGTALEFAQKKGHQAIVDLLNGESQRPRRETNSSHGASLLLFGGDGNPKTKGSKFEMKCSNQIHFCDPFPERLLTRSAWARARTRTYLSVRLFVCLCVRANVKVAEDPVAATGQKQ